MKRAAKPALTVMRDSTIVPIRGVFLAAVVEAAPEVLTSLLQECGPQARELASLGDPHLMLDVRVVFDFAKMEAAIDVAGSGKVKKLSTERHRLRWLLTESLTDWACEYRLTDRSRQRNLWLLQHALHVAGGLRQWGNVTTEPCDDPAAKAFRVRQHPERMSETLGPLARDTVWLVHYVLLQSQCEAFAPGVSARTLNKQSKAAANLIKFDLPIPLRLRGKGA